MGSSVGAPSAGRIGLRGVQADGHEDPVGHCEDQKEPFQAVLIADHRQPKGVAIPLALAVTEVLFDGHPAAVDLAELLGPQLRQIGHQEPRLGVLG